MDHPVWTPVHLRADEVPDMTEGGGKLAVNHTNRPS
jgi:hypothetical protein